MFGFVLAVTFVVLVLAFRSVVVAGTAVVLNLLSVGAAYGLLVLVFQHGVGAGLLGVQQSGFIVDWLPLFLFVILFGLSMDYHVFVVSRIREAHALGVPTRAAVARGRDGVGRRGDQRGRRDGRGVQHLRRRCRCWSSSSWASGWRRRC